MNTADFKPNIVYTIYVAARSERVWQALTSAEFSRQYFFGFATEAGLKGGGAFNVHVPTARFILAARSSCASRRTA